MRRIQIHPGVWKPVLFMGCEKLPFLIVAISSALLIMEGGLWVKIGGVMYFAVTVGAIALVNAREPFFFQIIWRYKSYQDFYPSNAMYPGKPDNPKNF